jgi:hypothetical protein
MSLNFQEFRGISRNFAEFRGILQNFTIKMPRNFFVHCSKNSVFRGKSKNHFRGHPTFCPTDNFLLIWSAGMTSRGDTYRRFKTESTEWFIEVKAFLQSYDSASRLSLTPFPLSRQQLVSLSQSSCVSPRSSLLTGYVEGRGWARSQIIQPRESLALYSPFNTLLTSKKF